MHDCDVGATVCAKCDFGMFQSVVGQQLCQVRCCFEAGLVSLKVSLHSFSIVSQPCDSGLMANETGLSICYSCWAGTFSKKTLDVVVRVSQAVRFEKVLVICG